MALARCCVVVVTFACAGCRADATRVPADLLHCADTSGEIVIASELTRNELRSDRMPTPCAAPASNLFAELISPRTR